MENKINSSEDIQKKVTNLENVTKKQEQSYEMMLEKVLQLEIFKKSNDQYYEKTIDCFKKLTAKMDETLNDDNEFQNEISEFLYDNEENYDQEKSNLLDETFANPSLGYSCDMCEFVGKTKSGLKTHKSRKHNKNV